MSIRLYNTLTRRPEDFQPIDPERVRLYVCGPTVYDFAHIGNARPVVVFDVLFRLLRHHFGAEHVIYARNITDVDDKIMAAADASGETIGQVTERTTKAFHDDMAALGALPPTVEPRATGTIAEMIELIEGLIEKGHAYAAEGHVLFSVGSFADYGQLSRRDSEELLAGARIDVAPYKRDPMDFVLWKPSSAEQPGWDSPWGRGRPGWHIECSAMSWKHLGPVFDIHGGGLDLIFPHHENEIAQSESSTGKPFANYWLHAEHLIVDGEKMSKSLGNFYTLKELLGRGVEPRAMRYLLLGTHYRKKLNFTFEGLDDATNALRRIDEMRFRLQHAGEEPGADSPVCQLCDSLVEDFTAAIADDLNIAGALGALFSFIKAINVKIETQRLASGDRDRVFEALSRVDEVLGILDSADWQAQEVAGEGPSDEEINALVAERQAARAERDFERADAARDQLAALGVVVEDTPTGPRWKRQ